MVKGLGSDVGVERYHLGGYHDGGKEGEPEPNSPSLRFGNRVECVCRLRASPASNDDRFW